MFDNIDKERLALFSFACHTNRIVVRDWAIAHNFIFLYKLRRAIDGVKQDFSHLYYFDLGGGFIFQDLWAMATFDFLAILDRGAEAFEEIKHNLNNEAMSSALLLSMLLTPEDIGKHLQSLSSVSTAIKGKNGIFDFKSAGPFTIGETQINNFIITENDKELYYDLVDMIPENLPEDLAILYLGKYRVITTPDVQETITPDVAMALIDIIGDTNLKNPIIINTDGEGNYKVTIRD